MAVAVAVMMVPEGGVEDSIVQSSETFRFFTGPAAVIPGDGRGPSREITLMSDLLLDGWMLLLGATAAVMVVYYQESSIDTSIEKLGQFVRFVSCACFSGYEPNDRPSSVHWTPGNIGKASRANVCNDR